MPGRSTTSHGATSSPALGARGICAARWCRDRPRADGIWVERDGRRLLSFSCNDYLNLTQHPALKAAATAAIERYGVGRRRLAARHRQSSALRRARSAAGAPKDTEAACVFGSGYLANAGIIPALIGRDDLVLIDELAHACLWAGARLSRGDGACRSATTMSPMSPICSPSTASRTTARLIVTDGVFSMDGDLAPLPELAALARQRTTPG